MARGDPLERTIVERIRKALEARGAWTFKLHGDPYQPKGIDLFVCYRGRFIALEVKRPGYSPDDDPLQTYILSEIAAAGGLTATVTSPEEALHVLS